MRLMETIRRKGHWFLMAFLIIFTVSLFFGLTAGFNGSGPGCAQSPGTQNQVVGSPSVVRDKGLEDVALTVDGRKISNDVYDQVVNLFVENYGLRDDNDPSKRLQAYGYAITMLSGQEVLIAYGEKHGIKLSAEDWEKAKADASQNFMPTEAEKKGNILGDTMGKLGEMKARKMAFEKYLQTQGLTESQWQRDAQRSLYSNKVRDEIKEEVNKEKAAEAEKAKAEVDKELTAKKNFADVAKAHSEGASASSGGDLDWIGRALLEKDVTDKLFAVKKGEISDWIKIPAGWQKFQVYDKKEASGAEYEKKKAELTKQIRDEKKDQKYEPSAEELRDKYEQVRARVIELKDTDDMKAGERIEEMIQAAQIEINNPYALAFEALKDYKLQPISSVTKDELIKIAQLAPLGDGYDFSLIDKKLAAGKPKAAKSEEKKDDAKADDKAEGAKADDTKAVGDDAVPDTSGAASMTDSAPKDEPEHVTTPIYALGAGLLERAVQDSNGTGGDPWPMFMQAKVLFDWLKDTAEANKQPVKTNEAREKLEQLLVQVVKSNNYSAMAHALRGLNLARLEKTKEAKEELDLAMKYGPSEPGETWETIREGYKVVDDTAKLAEVDKKIQDLQQKQFQEMLQRQLQQQGGGQGMPIQVQ